MNGTMTSEQYREFVVAYKKLQSLADETLECELKLVTLMGISERVEVGPSYTALMKYTPETFLEACGIKIQGTGEENNG